MLTFPLKYRPTPLFSLVVLSAAVLSVFGLGSCASSTTPSAPAPSNYNQVNLVSDTTSFGAPNLDTNLANAWGIAFGPTGKPWVAANHTGSSTIYDSNGVTALTAVKIPLPGAVSGGAPTGIVFNGTTDFGGDHFVFATEDGTIAGWKTGPSASILSNQSANGSVYKGLAMVSNSSGNFLYATNFHNNTIDKFDNTLTVTNLVGDPTAGYAPFGIQNINDTLFVTYARQKVGMHDDSSGSGIGYVSMLKADGTLIGRFTSAGNLSSPWGIALAPSGFGSASNAILIGNFGDGTINIFDHTGHALGQLQNASAGVLSIKGLWGIAFNPAAGVDHTKLYFAAGPYDENHGLFGYLKP